MSHLKTAARRAAAFLDSWHWALLALASPLLLFPSPLRTLALLIVPGLWIVAWLAGHEPLPRTPLDGAMLLLSLMVLVSLYATYDIAVSLPKVAGMVLGIGIFYAVVRVGQSPRGRWLSLLAFLVIGVAMASFGLLGTKWVLKVGFLTPIVARLPARVTGLPGAEEGLSPNQLAGALLWVVPVLIALAAQMFIQNQKLRIAFGRGRAVVLIVSLGGATLLAVGVLMLTQSRSGHIGFVFGILSLLVVALPLRKRWLLGALVILAVAGGLALSRFDVTMILRQVLGSASADSSALSLDTLEGRVEIWSRALYGIQDLPFTGMGMNTFRRVVHVLYPLFLVGPDFDIAHAHNEFLQAALDLGLPGLIAFIALYIGAFWMLREIWQIANQEPPSPTLRSPLSTLYSPLALRALVLGLGSGLFAHIIYGMTDAVALGAKPGILFWMLLGLIAGLFEQAQSAQHVDKDAASW